MVANKSLRVLLWQSVPKVPTNVVTPAFAQSLKEILCTLLSGPSSPPPPMMWTCWSTSPGITSFPCRSIDSKPGRVTERSFPSAPICPSKTRMSWNPRSSGAWTRDDHCPRTGESVFCLKFQISPQIQKLPCVFFGQRAVFRFKTESCGIHSQTWACSSRT